MIDLLSLLYPQRCCFCGKIIEKGNTCKECIDKLPYLPTESCPLCFMPRRMCCCHHPFNGCASLFWYMEPVRSSLHGFKFRGERYKQVGYGLMLASLVKREYSRVQFDYIVPVPMEKAKQKARGYNQAECLAVELSKHCKIRILRNNLAKVRKTASQHTLSARERKANLEGAYQLRKADKIKGKTILLVDDIVTTANTLSECAKVLKSGGASMVYCVTVAATPPRENDRGE